MKVIFLAGCASGPLGFQYLIVSNDCIIFHVSSAQITYMRHYIPNVGSTLRDLNI